MKHLLLKIVPAAAIVFTCASTAAETPAQAGPDFTHPKFNQVDDLSDYGGDYHWPASSQVSSQPVRRAAKTTPEPAPQKTVPVKINFTGSQFNTTDNLSDYGGNYRWPVTERRPDSEGKDLAIVGQPEE